MRTARKKEGGNGTDIGRKEKKIPTLWQTPSPEIALGSRWFWSFLRPEEQAISLRVTFSPTWEWALLLSSPPGVHHQRLLLCEAEDGAPDVSF